MVAVVLLAAGCGSRMEKNKQTLPWKEGKTIIQASLENILACTEIEGPVRVVVGAESIRVQENLKKYSDPRLEIVKNPDYSRGMLSSIKAGLASLPEKIECFFIALADQPMISPGTYTCLLELFRRGKGKIIVPVYKNQRGHPVLISVSFLEEIRKMPDSPEGLRPLLRRYGDIVFWQEVNDPGITIDLDYPEDYFYYRREEKE